jgi:adenylate cyclase
VQRAMAERNTDVPAARRIEFRIGIHQGDIIIDEGDIFGDGVNLAARLEGLAEPGGICVSRVVRDEVRDKLDVSFDDLGEQQVKNIARPVRAFAVRAGPQASRLHAGETPAIQAPLALPDKPSLAVLPFQNMSGDPEQEYFADGMVEEITTAIARLPWLFVIARNSAFTYKGKAIDVKQVARELGVRYVLEGSVRKAGNRVRITGQLIDAATGNHIWADHFDGALDDIFDLQDQVAASVAGAIEPKLRQSEIERASRKPTESLDAYDLYLRAIARTYAADEEGFAKAIELLRQALRIDPSYAPAAGLLSWCHNQRRAGWRGTVSPADIAEAIGLARQALDTARDDPDTLWQAGFALSRLAGETARGLAALDRAVALNPSAAMAWVAKGFVHAHLDQPEAAIDALNRALRLSPFDPRGYYIASGLAHAHLAGRRCETAIEWADRALHDNPGLTTPKQVKVVALAHLGRLDEARAEVARMLAMHPKHTIANFRALFVPTMAPEAIELYVSGLRLAGLPEG